MSALGVLVVSHVIHYPDSSANYSPNDVVKNGYILKSYVYCCHMNSAPFVLLQPGTGIDKCGRFTFDQQNMSSAQKLCFTGKGMECGMFLLSPEKKHNTSVFTGQCALGFTHLAAQLPLIISGRSLKMGETS